MRTDERVVCAACKHFHINAPPDWSPPTYDENAAPDLWDWVKCCRAKHGSGGVLHWRRIGGNCGVDPVHVPTTGGHGCGRYVDHSTLLTSKSPARRVEDYCRENLRDKQIHDLQHKIKHLNRQVLYNRKLAKSRLERLKVAKARR